MVSAGLPQQLGPPGFLGSGNVLDDLKLAGTEIGASRQQVLI